MIYESTHDNSTQQLENDFSEATINVPEEKEKGFNSRTSKTTNKRNKKEDGDRASSRESNMSRNSRRHRGGEGDPGVNPLIIKGMQDRMETINKNIDEIQTRSMDGYNTVMQFSDSFFALKKK